MEIFDAHKQWASRSADETYHSLETLLAAAKKKRDISRECERPWDSLQVYSRGKAISLASEHGEADLNHYSFGQLCITVGAPADYLRSLPAEKAADCLNYGLQHSLAQKVNKANVLLALSDRPTVRAITTSRYDRLWDCDVVSRCLPLTEQGWTLPPLSRPNPQGVQTRGLYLTDRECFVFMVSDKCRTFNGLSRGFFLSNSEVGAGALTLTCFLYDYICGNHIVWGASEIKRARFVHRGNKIEGRLAGLVGESSKLLSAPMADTDATIRKAIEFSLGTDAETVTDWMYAKRLTTRQDAEAAYALAEVYEAEHKAAPTSAWGMVSGLTRLSQSRPYASDRLALDAQASKILEYVA